MVFRRTMLAVLLAAAVSVVSVTGCRDRPDFGDPARVPPPPKWAIGFPSRAADLDVKPGFQSPPSGYGEVAFFWWLGDPLTKERLAWQLDQLAGKGVTGLQINYAHSDKGGVSYGLTLPSDPPLFSPAWWELVRWFAAEAEKRGMSISLSDYTLGLGQGWAMDAALAEMPDLAGTQLEPEWKRIEDGGEGDWVLPEDLVSLTAHRWADDAAVPGSGLDLRGRVENGRLRWRPPEGEWRVLAVRAKTVRPSFDPTHPASGRAYVKHFFEPFEKNLPGQAGRALNFFFSDELEFRLPGRIWSERLAAEFRARKGYDLGPELSGLFTDIGPRTPKIRLDYNDVRVALSEKNFFRPVFEWHQSRGLIFGCDHGGRGLDVTEFGDYFRTQRWNQGPGADQPGMEKNLIKAKVASSIAHLYERPRVWLEGYHSSGWGTTSAGIADATFANFLMGFNLLSFHGLYYSTHGGWWEWAPPDNHWRMPYWRHMGVFMGAVERLSYLLSQGRHVCDAAVMYPVAPAEAGLGGKEAVETAFAAGRALYGAVIDFDFIDFESVVRAKAGRGSLDVAGESYRVLVLPAMRAIRFSALLRAAEFARAGGIVVALGALPEAGDQAGREDPELDRLVGDLFGLDARAAAALQETSIRRFDGGGLAAVIPSAGDLSAFIRRTIEPDMSIGGEGAAGRYFLHRRVGPRDVYAFYGFPKDTQIGLRATGRAELWDPWTGQSRPLPVLEQSAATTRLRLPLDKNELQLIVFGPGRPEIAVERVAPAPSTIEVDGPWTVELKPCLDNRWGDFRWPPRPGFIGAESSRFRYALESGPRPGWSDPAFDDSSWERKTSSFGPMFRRLGPLPADLEMKELEAVLARASTIDPSQPVRSGRSAIFWKPYEFSWRWGVEGDPGHQGYHGLKEEMSDDFIRLGRPKQEWTAIVREMEPEGSRYYLWTTVAASAPGPATIRFGGMTPAAAWLNGRPLAGGDQEIDLNSGANPLLLRYDQPGIGHVLVVRPGFVDPPVIPGALAMRWFETRGIIPFDVHPRNGTPAGWYRFRAAPGLRALTVTAKGELDAWADGRLLSATSVVEAPAGAKRHRFVLPGPIRGEALIALRVAHVRGFYGGAALPDPVEFECGEGVLATGDWSEREGLESYSGGVLYRKSLVLPELSGRRSVGLDLGGVASSAEVFLNGRSAGVRTAPPWRWDITGLARPGENKVEVLVYNTLANHFLTIPTRYRGSPTSGLLGPVRVILD